MSSVSQQFRRLISHDFETAVFWVLLRSCIVQNAACNNCRVKNFFRNASGLWCGLYDSWGSWTSRLCRSSGIRPRQKLSLRYHMLPSSRV